MILLLPLSVTKTVTGSMNMPAVVGDAKI